jgi:hypothetical protein
MVVNESVTGIAQVINPESQFSIYPIVSNGQFFIENKELQSAGYNLSIYNVTGERVFSKTLNSKLETLNLNVPAGLYFVWMKTESSNTLRKIVIQ